MFVDSDLKIVAQIVLPVQHCLLSNSPRSQIKKLFAHPQSLGQCRVWVQTNLPRVEIIETSSNARSAEFAAKETGTAAIAGILAAEKYDLDVLEYDIQDNAANATRFLVLGRQCSPPTGKDRTSIMVSVTDKVGALHSALAAFRRYRINSLSISTATSRSRRWRTRSSTWPTTAISSRSWGRFQTRSSPIILTSIVPQGFDRCCDQDYN
jgi:chorismate mutase/prephenate dehydratase